MDNNRRKFLKIILIGGGTILVGKVFGPLFLRFLDGSYTKTNSSTTKTNSTDFQVVQNNRRLSIYDNSGEEIFQIDDGA